MSHQRSRSDLRCGLLQVKWQLSHLPTKVANMQGWGCREAFLAVALACCIGLACASPSDAREIGGFEIGFGPRVVQLGSGASGDIDVGIPYDKDLDRRWGIGFGAEAAFEWVGPLMVLFETEYARVGDEKPLARFPEATVQWTDLGAHDHTWVYRLGAGLRYRLYEWRNLSIHGRASMGWSMAEAEWLLFFWGREGDTYLEKRSGSYVQSAVGIRGDLRTLYVSLELGWRAESYGGIDGLLPDGGPFLALSAGFVRRGRPSVDGG